MASPMEQSQRRDESEFNLREWALKARISRENTNSRRFSASNIRSFREDTRSFRSTITISSTASSPGYPLKDEIDPSTYSFTTALKALQARSGYYSWECSSPDGFALNSKWNEAEKYICNPLSGEVPMECLSAKTLSGRSFRNLTNRITMSAPLSYSSHSRQFQKKPSTSAQDDLVLQLPIPETKTEGMTRDVGTQSTPPDLSSSSPSPASTPSIIERAINRYGLEGADSPHSNVKIKTKEEKMGHTKFLFLLRFKRDAQFKRILRNIRRLVEVKETRGIEETKREKVEKKKKDGQMFRQAGCLSWMRKKRQREKRKPRTYNIFLTHLKGC